MVNIGPHTKWVNEYSCVLKKKQRLSVMSKANAEAVSNLVKVLTIEGGAPAEPR